MRTHVLIGGTGTLGQALTQHLLDTTEDRIRIVARNEYQMGQMKRSFASNRLSYIIADIRDEDRIRRVLVDAHWVYHLAALKHVHTCEYDVLEAARTNVEGTANVLRACIDAGVEKAVLVSTDKAVEPTTSYGAMKMVAERMFIYGNSYRGAKAHPAFHCVRYGNVLGSHGSVVEVWRERQQSGKPIGLSDPAITRFWWTPADAAAFVAQSMHIARAGDVLVPLMPSCSLAQLADLVAPGHRQVTIEGYSTEKTHEVLIAPYELDTATYVGDMEAVRLPYLSDPPANEHKWNGSQLSSQAAVSLAGVSRCL
jgi:UDP-N-acetylglucosamine 4,6-dehydratase/5-epimerase